MIDYPIKTKYINIKPICNNCAVNQFEIPTELIDVVGANICSKCDDKPCTLVHITEVAYSYFLTPYGWFLQRIKGIKGLSSIITTSGSLYHAMDDFISVEFPDRFNKLKKIDNKVMLFYKILNLLVKQLEFEVIKVLKVGYERFGFTPYDIIPFMIEMSFPMVSKLAHRETNRIYNAVKYKLKFNPYKKIGKFVRERVIFFYEEVTIIDEENELEYTYRILNKGSIDEVKDFNKYSIGFDDKSANMPEREYDSYSIQFGGYNRGHKFVYNKPLISCNMRYPMFELVVPIEPDENRYMELLKEMCKVDYYYTKSPTKRILVDKTQCNYALCKEQFCSLYFPCRSKIFEINEVIKRIVESANKEIDKWRVGSTVIFNNFSSNILNKHNIKQEEKKLYNIEEIEEEGE